MVKTVGPEVVESGLALDVEQKWKRPGKRDSSPNVIASSTNVAPSETENTGTKNAGGQETAVRLEWYAGGRETVDPA